jgi:hypothetical protein
MRLPRVRLTVRWMMGVVAVVSLLLPPAIWIWRSIQNLNAYMEWASDQSSTRPTTYHLPYPNRDGQLTDIVMCLLLVLGVVGALLLIWRSVSGRLRDQQDV